MTAPAGQNIPNGGSPPLIFVAFKSFSQTLHRERFFLRMDYVTYREILFQTAAWAKVVEGAPGRRAELPVLFSGSGPSSAVFIGCVNGRSWTIRGTGQ